jgi:hypothetical protein
VKIYFIFKIEQIFSKKKGDIPISICFCCQIVEILPKKKITNYNMCSMARARLMDDEKYFNVGLF